MEDKVLDAIIFAILAVVFVASVYPFFLAIVLSFNEGLDAQLGGIYLWPRKPTLQNYEQLFKDLSWVKAIGVTAARTVLGSFLTVMFTSVVAYGLSQRELIGRKAYMGVIIFAMYFSGGIIPYYAVLRSLRLLNSFAVYIAPSLLNIFYMLVAISFFQGLPSELNESARIDGAGEIKIFSSIVIPVSLPLIATIAIFTSVGHWNSWYDSAFFIQNDNLRTLAYKLMAVIRRSYVDFNSAAATEAGTRIKATSLSVQLAAMTIAVTPILAVYPFFQRYIIAGTTLGSVKG
jgi:putative aldouronate transport system permease protein